MTQNNQTSEGKCINADEEDGSFPIFLGEEICISGISGTFPNCPNVRQLKENLYNKVNMVSGDERRWKHFHPEIPTRSGKIYNAEKFDSGFFGIPYRHVNTMDPMQRIILEKAIECIFDAGVHPSELEGTKTGIFVASCFAEAEQEIYYRDIESRELPILGGSKSMLCHRLSSFLKLRGPSYVIDTACSSSLYAVDNAFNHIKDGICNMAIVGGCNLCLNPLLSLQFARLGLLSADGSCRSFDESGTGYCRSEAINCLFLQKAKNCRRIYAKVVHTKTNCDGYKDLGISHPSKKMQQRLLKEFYEECQVDPAEVGFLESHGTGTPVGDVAEGEAIDKVFCHNRKKPLLIGSIKSNLGHTEASAGITSIIKCIIAMEEARIPPNLHHTVPRKPLKGFQEGRMKVVNEETPLPDKNGLMALSSFGFGGANAHVLLEWNHKEKVNAGVPDDDLPRLICASGRTPEAVTSLLDTMKENFDAEYVQLLQEIFKKNIDSHNHRGFSIVSKSGMISSSCKGYSEVRPELIVIFSDFGSSFQSLAKKLLKFPVFAETIQSIHHILIQSNVRIFDILQKSRNHSAHPSDDNILGNLSLQIGIIELLKDLDIEPNVVLPTAASDIACAYSNGSLTLKQAITAALEVVNHLKKENQNYDIYVIKPIEEELLRNLTRNTKTTWKYLEESAVISGRTDEIQKYIKIFQKKGTKIIKVRNYYDKNSETKETIENGLSKKLKNNIPNLNQNGTCCFPTPFESMTSLEYLEEYSYSTNTSQNFVHTREIVILEVGLEKLSKWLRYRRSNISDVVSFENCLNGNSLVGILKLIGNLYEQGFNPQIQNLYPRLQYPVSRGTPMISDKIKWEHSTNWHVMRHSDINRTEYAETTISVFPEDDAWQYMKGHVIDGRQLFPATGYIDLVWKSFAEAKGTTKTKLPVIFENCRFSRATSLKERIDFTVAIQKKSGNFEIIEEGVDIVSGRVISVDSDKLERHYLPLPHDDEKEETIIMKSEDIYKEFNLRGYNYKCDFKMIQKCNMGATIIKVKWTGNWVTFLDNMIQAKLLQYDTRLLYIPVGLRRISIDAEKHLRYVKSFGDNPILPVYNFKDADIVRCGGIEIRGLLTSSIGRRKTTKEPLLEKYQFVSNEYTTTLLESVRINVQIAAENLNELKFNVIELIDEASVEAAEPLAPSIAEAFSHHTLVQANIVILTKKMMEFKDINVENNTSLSNKTNCHFIVASNILQRTVILNQALGSLKENGFILSREKVDFHIDAESTPDIDIATIHTTKEERLILFRKCLLLQNYEVVRISETDQGFNWLKKLKILMETTRNIVIYSQNEDTDGLLGFYNCIRQEAGGTNIQCFSINGEETPLFNIDHPFYQKQLRKKLSVNIYKERKWGTYRHLLLKDIEEVESEHCMIDQTVTENISSMKLVHGPLSSNFILPPDKILVNVYFAPLNFKDVMTASGRIHRNLITRKRIENFSFQGHEFSGIDSRGRRVMGMSLAALSNFVAADKYLLSEIPEDWTMEEAATVPVVYGTVLYSMIERGKIKRGESILIHLGTGGIGQAAINVALAIGCNVFTTVGTPEKREFLRKLFPQLEDQQIGNSRDTTFEIMVKNQTQGRGVDLVLNSLAEDKLFASIRCLAKGGRFLEIGKFDCLNDNRLALMLLQKECSFHGVMLDEIIFGIPSMKSGITTLIKQGIKSGMVKPLTTNLFQINEVQDAYRFMTTGKHIGKIVIQIQKEECEKNNHHPSAARLKGFGRFFCDPEKSYIILGGLGGFGLELADWLVLRGAKKLILSSRTGIRKGYQAFNINIWKSYGVIVKISTDDVTTREGCEKLINEAEKVGPVDALFNVAVVLKDCLLENQSLDTFKVSFRPKATATKYLDEITRSKCTKLRHFVLFSSLTCGRGIAGQTNYGMANSKMERICECRRKSGYPALAIQWGAVGDVGLLAENEKSDNDIGGCTAQGISSCLQVMDIFLSQNEAAIVSSIVLADKNKGRGFKNIVDSTAKVLGIKTSTISLHSTLAELGMDSLTAVEVKQTLELEFDLFLSAHELRSLTFARLQEIQDGRYADETSNRDLSAVDLFLKNINDDNSIAPIPVVTLNTPIENSVEAPFVFIFGGIEGYVKALKPLAVQLKTKVLGLQCYYKLPPANIATTAEECLSHINIYSKPEDLIHIIAYSWGTIIALEVTARLEKQGHKVHLVIIDGAPEVIKEMVSKNIKFTNNAEMHVSFLCLLMLKFVSLEVVHRNKKILEKCTSSEERLEVFLEAMKTVNQMSRESMRMIAIAMHDRIRESYTYKPSYGKISANIKLFKPLSPLYKSTLPEDYYLSKICTNLQEIKYFEGDHQSMLENPKLAEAINDTINKTTFEDITLKNRLPRVLYQ